MRHNIKFALISQESLPYLAPPPPHAHLFKGFRKNSHKENISPQLHSSKSGQLPPISEGARLENEKAALRLQKLRNRRNHEREKLRLEYENLRINTIIECAAQDLIENQNKMLYGMI